MLSPQAAMFRAMTMMCRSVVNLKRVIIAISVIIVLAAVFASCRQGSITENAAEKVSDATAQEATTVIVDENGVTHYYKIVSDNPQGEESTTVLAKIATNNSGEPITNKFGEYVTIESTTVITSETTTAAADANDVPFDSPDNENTTGNNEATETETIPDSPTDSDGWIDRWY